VFFSAFFTDLGNGEDTVVTVGGVMSVVSGFSS
jgi:hypothetical protein